MCLWILDVCLSQKRMLWHSHVLKSVSYLSQRKGSFVQWDCPVRPLQTHLQGFLVLPCVCLDVYAHFLLSQWWEFCLLCPASMSALTPLGRTWEKTLILRYSSQLSRLCAATPHCTLKSAGRPVAVSARSSGQTGHAGRLTLTGKIPLALNPDEWILGEWDVWRKGEMLARRAVLFGSTIIRLNCTERYDLCWF